MCIVTACSTGTHNIGEAAEGIRRGDFIAAIAGSTETPLYEIGYIGFSNMRGMGTPREGEPLETVSRPFDRTRNGFVLGEGAGAMVLEDLEYAQGARGAHLRRGRRLRLRRRRLGPHPAHREGRRHPARHRDGPRAPRRAARRGRPDQPAWHVHAAGRPARGAGLLGRLRRPHAGDRHQRHQVDDRPPDGRRRGGRGRLHRAVRLPPVRPGDPQLPRPRPGDQPQRRPGRSRGRWRSATR